MTMQLKPFMPLAAVALTTALLLAGCGSGSKPAYCTQVTNFENSVNTLEQVEVSPSNLSTIATDVQKVGTSSKELVSAVKTEFAPQINSMKGSVAAKPYCPASTPKATQRL
jgi:outer membrane murein-binding lipoprotein Lpp